MRNTILILHVIIFASFIIYIRCHVPKFDKNRNYKINTMQFCYVKC